MLYKAQSIKVPGKPKSWSIPMAYSHVVRVWWLIRGPGTDGVIEIGGMGAACGIEFVGSIFPPSCLQAVPVNQCEEEPPRAQRRRLTGKMLFIKKQKNTGFMWGEIRLKGEQVSTERIQKLKRTPEQGPW